jgi:heptosyltransferase III
MGSILERLPSGARVSVVRLRSLGDCVLTTPTLRLLKSCRPDIELAIVVEDRFRAVFERNPDVDRTLAPSAAAAARFRPYLCINFHGGTRSAALTLASLAPLRAGFAHFRAQAVYNVRIPRAQDILGEERTVHTAEHLASAIFYLGAPATAIPPARLFFAPGSRSGSYAVIHPFASAPDKTWPAERFNFIASRLRGTGLDVVMLAGPRDDPASFERFEIARNLPLAEVGALIGSAALFIGNDSGPAHIAAACGTPSVVLFGGSDPVIWAPWKSASAVQVIAPSMAAIRPADVLAAVESRRVHA